MSKQLSDFDLPFSAVEAKPVEWVEEALELRHGAGDDPKGSLNDVYETDTPEELMRTLLRVTNRANRVDELLAKITRARGRARRAKHQAQFEAEHAYAQAMRKNASRRSLESFTSAKEKDSDASLDSFEQRRFAHKAERLVSLTEECYDVISQIHWQLEGMRKDLRTMIHALNFDSHLER